jgi:hypothetical protein
VLIADGQSLLAPWAVSLDVRDSPDELVAPVDLPKVVSPALVNRLNL